MRVKLAIDNELKFKLNTGMKEGLEKLAAQRNQSIAETLRGLVAEAVVNAIAAGELKYDKPVEPENETLKRMNEAFKQAGKERRSIRFEY